MNPNSNSNNSCQQSFPILSQGADFRNRQGHQDITSSLLAPQGAAQFKQYQNMRPLIQRPPQSSLNMQNLSNSKEFCQKHNEINVGWNEQTKEIVCNSCIYQKKQGQLKFTALVSKELKDAYLQAFNKYNQSKSSVSEIDSSLIKQHLISTINSFFNNLQSKVKELEVDVTSRIKQSDSLKELNKILDSNKEFFSESQQPNHYEKAKNEFDQSIAQGRFASIVKKRDFYKNLIDNIDKTCLKMKQTIDQSSDQLQRVIKLQANEKILKDGLTDIVKDCIMVDNEKVQDFEGVRGQPPDKRIPSGGLGMSNHQNGNHKPQMPQLNLQPRQFPPQQEQPQQIPPPQQQMPSFNNPVLAANLHAPQPSLFNQPTQQMQNQLQFQNQQQQRPLIQNPNPQMTFSNQMPFQSQPKQDDVAIIGTGHSEIIPEHNYKTFFKLKSMSLLKLLPNKGWARIQEVNQLFMAKCIYTPEERVFVIGGAKDNKTKETIKDVVEYRQLPNGSASATQRAPMIDSRASFGVTICPKLNQIYVAGGYILGEVNKKCERYSIANDQWTQLPDLNEEKCSASLCVLDNKYLYSIGGLSKFDGQIQLISTIERLDILNPQSQWQILNINMPEPACDVGCLAVAKDEILVFGGWNKTAIQTTYIIKKTDIAATFSNNRQDVKHELKHVDASIEKPDFFLASGFATKGDHPNQVKVCGHSQLFTYDLKLRKFVGFSNV